jgi:NADH-quinone oxidoreductase subunit J
MAWAPFLVIALAAVASAVGVVLRRNPLHAALYLVTNLFCVAVLYLLQRAEFLALAQVIVYAGAIMVLFLFAIMLLIPGRTETGPDPLRAARRLAVPVAGAFGLALVLVAARTGGSGAAPGPVGVAALGRLLFTDYLFPFEVTSVLLLAALVGALVLAKRTPS